MDKPPGPSSQSADRRTTLASDRTLLAAERTYAAWVRTGLASLASGVGARTLLHDVLPLILAKLSASILILFAGFCIVAAVWRELRGAPRTPSSDIPRLPAALLLPINTFLLIVVVVALAGVWVT